MWKLNWLKGNQLLPIVHSTDLDEMKIQSRDNRA
jgi:hypothetical protein